MSTIWSDGAKATHSWSCPVCGREVARYRGQSNPSCVCGAQFNAAGQRLRDDWQGNPSNYDDELSDLDGYEQQHAGDE